MVRHTAATSLEESTTEKGRSSSKGIIKEKSGVSEVNQRMLKWVAVQQMSRFSKLIKRQIIVKDQGNIPESINRRSSILNHESEISSQDMFTNMDIIPGLQYDSITPDIVDNLIRRTVSRKNSTSMRAP